MKCYRCCREIKRGYEYKGQTYGYNCIIKAGGNPSKHKIIKKIKKNELQEAFNILLEKEK